MIGFWFLLLDKLFPEKEEELGEWYYYNGMKVRDRAEEEND